MTFSIQKKAKKSVERKKQQRNEIRRQHPMKMYVRPLQGKSTE